MQNEPEIIFIKLRFNHTMIHLPHHCFTFFYFVFLAHLSFGQMSGNFRKDSMDMKRIPEIQIALDVKNVSPPAKTVIFKSINVQDVRFDTTLIGVYSIFTNAFTPGVKNYKINVPGGLQKSVGTYLNSFFKASPSARDMELICFIKTLSLARRDTVASESSYKKYGQLNFAVEVFLRSGDNYYAAIKIDTTIYSVIDTKKKQINDDTQRYLLMPALQLLQQQIADTKWEEIAERKPFTKSVVWDHYITDRFNIPVLTQACKKGIYRSFAEFKNNSPYIENFKVEKGKFNTIILEDGEGINISTLRLFGFCDGEKYWVLMGNYSSPLFRVGNGFEFFLTFANRVKILGTLNMENGRIY
ncbi:MAG TPA: hypothetical protein VIJ75_22415 [Hanamia sp.]